MRYINPGYAAWFSVVGDSGSMVETTETTKTKTGTAFYNTSSANYISVDFPASGEIYCKFDFYYPGSLYNDFYFGEFSPTSGYGYNGFYFDFSSAGIRAFKNVNGDSIALFDERKPAVNFGFKANAINSILFHLKYTDSEDGFLELTINDYSFGRIEAANLVPYNKQNIRFNLRQSNKTAIYLSNVIISDEPVLLKEQIVPLQISSVETDMTFDTETGIYTATGANQTFLANVDVADLISDFGGNSRVTGVAMVGNPAYRTGEALSSFTALTKKNNTTTEYGTVNIPTNANSVVINGFNVASDTAIGDLQNMQFGWKVGE